MSTRTGNAELWLLDLTGGNERRLTDRAADDWAPDWSPDGRQIVFNSSQDGEPGLWVVGVEDGALRKLGDIVPYSSPHWAPDGSAIGCVVSTGGAPELVVVDPQTGTHRKVLDGVRSFEWYRDSRHVIYSWQEGSRTEMRVADIESGEERVLLDTPFVELAVSPDGSSVSYCSAFSHFNMNLHVLRLTPPDTPGGLPSPAGAPTAVTRGDGQWHVHNGGWSPDSKRVIYTRDTDTGDVYLLEGAL
jgi:TolB protein